MSKIGVGIGEDFPAGEPTPRDTEEVRQDCADYAARREAYRKWRALRRQWREEWRAGRRAFRRRMRQRHEDGSSRGVGPSFHWVRTIIWGALALSVALVLIALVNFIFSHAFVIAGVVALLALLAAYHRFDPFDLPAHDYSNDKTAPPQVAH